MGRGLDRRQLRSEFRPVLVTAPRAAPLSDDAETPRNPGEPSQTFRRLDVWET